MTVGQVFYDVLPDLSGFSAKVEAGLGSASFKPIKVKVEADTSGAQKVTAAAARAQAQQNAIAARGEAQLAAIRARGAQQRATLEAKSVAQQNAAQRRATAAAERGSARQAAQATRNAAREAAAVERAAARETAARERATAAAERASARATAAAERASAREAAAAERAALRGTRARQDATSKVGTGLLTAGALGAAGIGLVIAQDAKFEKAVSNTASTSSEAAANIGVLRGEAIKYGAATVFSATEAANAQAELIKANVSVSDTINGGLSGALDLASAGSLDVADAAGIMATAMSQFNIPGTQAGHVADLLAAAAGKAQGEVADFAGALKYAGPVAKASGVSIEETTGTLAEFANQGILGEQAGTSLRSMLVSLTAPAGAGAKAIDKYGISLRDSNGDFIGLAGAAGELQAKLGGLPKAERDAALARIFGKNSLTAATVLYQGGAAGVQQWTSAVNDSGFASRTAATKLDNLSGDVEKLGGAFQSAFIGAASSSTGPLRTVTQAITGVVDTYNNASDTFKSGSFIGAGFLAAAAIGVGGVIKLGGALRDAKLLAADLGTSLKTLTLKGGAVGLGLAAIAAVVGHFAVQQAEAKARTDDLTQSLIASNGAIDKSIASTRAKSLEDSGALESAQKLGISIEDITQASLGNVDAQGRVNDKLNTYAEVAGGLSTDLDKTQYAQSGVAEAARKVQEAIGGGNTELNNAVAAYQRQKAAADAAGGGQTDLAGAATMSATAMADAAAAAADVGTKSSLSASDVKALTDALFGESDAATAALDATIAYNNAVAGAGKIKGGGLSTKSAGGQANIGLLEREAKAIKDRAKAMIDSGASEHDVLKTYESGRAKLVEHAKASGADKDTIKKRTGALLETPAEVKTAYELTIKNNQDAKLADLQSKLAALPPQVQSDVQILIDAGDYKGAAARIAELATPTDVPLHINPEGGVSADKAIAAASRPRNVPLNVADKGTAGSKGRIDGAAKPRKTGISVSDKGTGGANSRINNAAKARKTGINVSDKGTPGAKRNIDGAAKPRKSNIAVTTSGIGAANSAINSAARAREATITVKTNDVTGATGGTYTPAGFVGRPPGFSVGGSVWGTGTSTSDSINARLANGEEVIRTAQAERNRAILKTINAGGEWSLVPKMARGGTQPSVRGGDKTGGTATATLTSARPTVIVNVDLGPELGGIRRIVADEVASSGEYAATVTRMRR